MSQRPRIPTRNYSHCLESGRSELPFGSGVDGYAVSTLPPGTYNVYEVVPPSGYKVDPLPRTVTITDGTTTEITMSDQRANGRVFIHKVSAPEGESIVPTAPVVDPDVPPIAVVSLPGAPGQKFSLLSDSSPLALAATLASIPSETDLPGAVFALSRPIPVGLTGTLRPYTLMVNGPGDSSRRRWTRRRPVTRSP